MKETAVTLCAAVALLGACQQQAQPSQARNEVGEEQAPTTVPANESTPATPPAPGTPGGLPDDRTPLEEPKGPIDPKSAEAAGQVVQSYGALIEQKKFAEAEKMWRDPVRAKGVSNELRGYSEAHLQIGKPSDPEGAAGSIYVSVPTVLYGKRKDGTDFSRSGEMTLRRVNDVPGSTAEQRQWRIESAAWIEKR